MKTRGVLTGAAAALVASVLAGGIAWAGIPGAGGVINGCYQKVQGQLRVIDPGTDGCRPSEIAITWNQQGTQGERGEPGARPRRRRRPRRRQRHRRPGARGRELRDGRSQGHRGKRRHVRL